MSGWTARALSPLGGLTAFVAGVIIVYLLGRAVTDVILAPLCSRLPTLDGAGCAPVFTSPKEVVLLHLRQGVLAGLVLAMPAIIAALARVLAPTLCREAPGSVVPYALAGGALALLGAAYAVFREAPNAFAPALETLAETASGRAPDMGLLAVNYANAVVVMADVFALMLQLPVLAMMMIRSRRTRRAIEAEGAR